MRLIKLSRKDEEFQSTDDVVKFFESTLLGRSVRGRFNVTRGAIGTNGMTPGEELLFAFEGECFYRARSNSRRFADDDLSDSRYPYYFIVDVDTIERVSGNLTALQAMLHRADIRTIDLHRSRAWPILDLDEKGLQIADDYLYSGIEALGTSASSAESAIRSFEKGQGFLSDSRLRGAIDEYAMTRARKFFETKRFACENVSKSKPFDLLCRKNGRELLVEVKGTSQAGGQIFLTRGEVNLSRESRNEMCLFVVHSIILTVRNESVTAAHGKIKIIYPWKAAESVLTALSFKCDITSLVASEDLTSW